MSYHQNPEALGYPCSGSCRELLDRMVSYALPGTHCSGTRCSFRRAILQPRTGATGLIHTRRKSILHHLIRAIHLLQKYELMLKPVHATSPAPCTLRSHIAGNERDTAGGAHRKSGTCRHPCRTSAALNARIHGRPIGAPCIHRQAFFVCRRWLSSEMWTKVEAAHAAR